LGLGLAGFPERTVPALWLGEIFFSFLCGLPMALAAVTIGLLAVGHSLRGVAAMMVVWGTLNSAIPVAWSPWLSKGIRDEPEGGEGFMVGAIQLAIMLGAGFGGLLLDHLSVAATFIGSAVLLAIASVAVGGADPPRD
jgi:predicted MFS family arabinose efflux permease